MKETFYFPHDYDCRKDPKISALINDFGMTGYGLFWAIVELIHEQGGKIAKFPKLFEGMAFQFGIEKETLTKQIEAMLHDYNLLQEDENFIWSKRVLKNIDEREAKRNLKIEAGRIGGLKSGITRSIQRSKRSKSKQCFEANEANEAKERKGKENKVNNNIKEIVKEKTPSNIAKEFLSSAEKQNEIVEQLIQSGCNPDIAKSEVQKFVDYWTEQNKSGTKQRWELEKTFEVGRRLKTWFRNYENFNPSQTKSYVA